jgi:hypothetical protein
VDSAFLLQQSSIINYQHTVDNIVLRNSQSTAWLSVNHLFHPCPSGLQSFHHSRKKLYRAMPPQAQQPQSLDLNPNDEHDEQTFPPTGLNQQVPKIE